MRDKAQLNKPGTAWMRSWAHNGPREPLCKAPCFISTCVSQRDIALPFQPLKLIRKFIFLSWAHSQINRHNYQQRLLQTTLTPREPGYWQTVLTNGGAPREVRCASPVHGPPGGCCFSLPSQAH